MSKRIISQNQNPGEITFCLEGVDTPCSIRFYKGGLEFLRRGARESFSMPYEDLKLRETRLYGTIQIEVFREDGQDASLLEEACVQIEPPVPAPSYHECGDILGTNYTPACCANQIEFWERLPAIWDRVNGELDTAKSLGFNSLRVFLHNRNYDRDARAFLERMEAFTAACAQRGIRPLYVFFDDCWYGTEETVLDFAPIPGMHNGRWAKCPLLSERKVENYPRFEGYVRETILRFQNDPRIFGWEIWNEPKNTGMPDLIDTEFTQDLMACAFGWARQAQPIQPVVSCWSGNRYGDVDDRHNYCGKGVWEFSEGVGCAPDCRRGTIVTEAGSRNWGNTGYGSPVHWLGWLGGRRRKGLTNPGVYLNWELMAGASNCAWHWSSKAGDPYPGVPWCGFLTEELLPVSVAEAAALQEYAGLESGAVLLFGFDGYDRCGYTPGDGFHTYSDGTMGVLRHSGQQAGRCNFDGEAPGGFILQTFLQLDENGRAGVAVAWGRETMLAVVCPEGISVERQGENTFVSRRVGLTEWHNLKIDCFDGALSIYLDDLSCPICKIKVAAQGPATFSVYAAGKAAFDDFAVIKRK